jgi:hypothetical protein
MDAQARNIILGRKLTKNAGNIKSGVTIMKGAKAQNIA